MADIIRLLPDSVANQIAAGEVIQRPASVVKELIENSIDAGSTQIRIIAKDAGRTLIQVVDDGAGMSETDARMAFERHATSKIASADDLFALDTMGFRGEALASIAAIAIVELKTRREIDELGTHIIISGSKVTDQETINCPKGTNFMVKNLFFNVPARRKFLKTNGTELKHIITEIHRVALAKPEISFTFHHNDAEILNFPIANLKQRIVHVFGRNINSGLVPIQIKNDMATITGFVSTPDIARKGDDLTYLFVNKRYMRHPYFHKAVLLAYDKLLPQDVTPPYFIYFDVDPKTIDVNIHPTKTEIKFENATAIFLILKSAVKEALGRYNIVPTLDFNTEGAFQIPVFDKDIAVNPPTIKVNPRYNPFNTENQLTKISANPDLENDNFENWEKFYEDFEKREEDEMDQFIQNDTFKFIESSKQVVNPENIIELANLHRFFFQLKGRYILTPVKSGLMIIDQKRAHERILYERFALQNQKNQSFSQQTLFPVKIDLPPADVEILKEILPDLNKIGFDIREFGSTTFVIYGFPSDISTDPKETFFNLLFYYKSTSSDIKKGYYDNLAKGLAKVSSISYGKTLSNDEMRDLVDQLFACQIPNFSPDGKSVISTMTSDEIDKKFN